MSIVVLMCILVFQVSTLYVLMSFLIIFFWSLFHVDVFVLFDFGVNLCVYSYRFICLYFKLALLLFDELNPCAYVILLIWFMIFIVFISYNL